MLITTRAADRFERRIGLGVALVIILTLAVVFIVDLQTPRGVGVWMFFAAPLAATYFGSPPMAPYVVATAITLLTIADYLYSAASATPAWISILNRTIFIVMIWSAAFALRQLIVSRLHLKERDWLRAGQSRLSTQTIGEQSLADLSARVLQFFSDYLDMRIGALYVLDSNGMAVRTAGFALPPDHPGQTSVAAGEGLLGQAFVNRQPLHLEPAPPDYLHITGALGEASATSVLIQPLFAEGEVVAAVELGFVRHAFESDKRLLELLAEPIGISLRSARLRAEREALLKATQRQAQELQAQQEELRVANEELEQQSQILRDSQARLEAQQSELEQTNVQLEEHTQLLAKQNDDLEHARAELAARATELKRSNQFKSEFLANMSHELRTPLNSSLILARLLGDNATGNLTDEQVKFARSIYSAGNDLLDLINDILDLSKIEARKIDMTYETINVPQLIEDLAQSFKPLADQKGLVFEAIVEAGTPTLIQSDGQRLRQVLRNLLSNAVKFTTRGAVKLRTLVPLGGPSSDAIAFEVADTGIGIKREQHDAIFEPFRQADGTTSRRFGGTGLGLSISRELATLLGGRIELQSTPGVGSTFVLTLPRSLPPRAAQETPQPTSDLPTSMTVQADASNLEPPYAAEPAMRAQRIRESHERLLLIIEDDATFANTLCDLAHGLNYQTLVAMSADEGIEMALRHRPTAIVLDIRLPDHTGLTVLDRLKHNPATRHIPVQVISGHDYTQAALEMGAASFMLKPVERDRLIEALERLERTATQAERAVLIVEDNSMQRDSIQALLKAENVCTVAVSSASAALDKLQNQTFDCMVLDLALPDSSGFELLERMAQNEACAFPPVIVYTARAISPMEEQRLRRHSESIIIKGARSPERLLDEVTLFLHKVEESLPVEQQRLLRIARSRDSVFDGRRILLAEDDVRNVFAITRVLEPHGAKLEIARNGLEALERLDRHPDIELVLMDIMMPEMDGLDAMRAIRQREATAQLPIIALTAKAMPDDRQRCLQAGANDYITKPIEVEKLLSLVRIWLAPRRRALP